jgi:hypothetical protein
MSGPKPKIENYFQYKKLARKAAFRKQSAATIASKYEVNWLSLLAWMARYQTEREYERHPRGGRLHTDKG